MNAYENKLEARKDYYERKAAEAEGRSNAHYQNFRKMGEGIPFGQPIIVGHHSESRDRNYRGRMEKQIEKSYEEGKKAEYYRRKANSVGKGGISSDDPDAISKLTAKMEKLEQQQEYMKNVNKAIRLKDTEKGDARLRELGATPEQIKTYRTPDFAGRLGFAPYELQNNNANIRRIRLRIKAMENLKQEQQETETIETDLYTFFVDDNRMQFKFDGKPEPAVRGILKRHAFKWSPARGAWVRQATSNGMYAAKLVRKELDESEAFDND